MGAGFNKLTNYQSRPYQDKAVDFLVDLKGRGGVLSDTGSGKTVIALRTAERLGATCILVLVPKRPALLAWTEALKRHDFMKDPDNDLVIMEKMPRKKRHAIWAKLNDKKAPEHDKPAIILALYQTVLKDVALITDKNSAIDFVICDEAHRLKNHQRKFYKSVKRIVRRRKRIFLTATPQVKGPWDLWTLLNMCSPNVFTSFWEFRARYCVLAEGHGGSKEIVGIRKKTLPELKQRVRGFLYAIKNSELDGWVPKRVRHKLYSKMDDDIATTYATLAEEGITYLPEGGIVVTPSTLAKYTKLRQLLACPKIVHPSFGVGNAFMTVMEHMEDNNPHVVIYSDFTECFTHWGKYLTSKRIPNYKLVGGMSATDVRIEVDKFSRHKLSGKPSVLMASIKFSESFDILSCNTGYFIGFSWNQNENHQAEGRLTRGDKPYCNFFYVTTEGTIDVDMVTMLNSNSKTSNTIINLQR